MTQFQSKISEQTENGTRDVSKFERLEVRKRLIAELPVVERRYRLNDIDSAVLEGGEGPPVILLHGPGENGTKWATTVMKLVATHRVIVPDLPGHGETDANVIPLDADRVLGWLEELIECSCTVPPTLVGHIVGGSISARFALRHGDRLSKLVLVDSLGLEGFQPTPEFGSALSAFVTDPTESTHDNLWRYCAHDFDALRSRMGERWELSKKYNLDRARSTTLQAAQHSLMEHLGFPAISSDELAHISVPVTLIWGRHDLATSTSVARDVSTRLHWPLHIIENSGDDPPLEQPEEFSRVLRSILDVPAARIGALSTLASQGAWNQIAHGYDKTNTPTQMVIAAEGLRRAGITRGVKFLDVAAGSGSLSIPAARLGAEVTAIDQSPVMLDLLLARAHREELNVGTYVMDGHNLEFDEDVFDIAGSQFGVMLFEDMPKGIREMVRVVRPGGRVLIHAYGDPHKIEFLSFLIAALQSVRPEFNGPPMDPPPLEFQLADPVTLREQLSAAGLQEIQVVTVTETTDYKTGNELWEWLIYSNPIVESILGGMLRVTADEREEVKRVLDNEVSERAGMGRIAKLTNPVNIGIGTKSK